MQLPTAAISTDGQLMPTRFVVVVAVAAPGEAAAEGGRADLEGLIKNRTTSVA